LRAAIVVDDPRISEVHAYVAFRGEHLRLLSLRGRLTVDGKPKSDVILKPETRVLLAGFFSIEVISVEIPEFVIALQINQGAPIVPVGVMTLSADDQVLREGFDPEALAVLWSGPGGLKLRIQKGSRLPAATAEADLTLLAGDQVRVGPHVVRVLHVSLHDTRSSVTDGIGQCSALSLTLHYDTVHISIEAQRPVILDGIAARIVSELAILRTPIGWRSLAETLWSGIVDAATLRKRWDQALTRLRAKLREGNVRSDLVRANHGGLVELALGPEDHVEDRT